MRRALSFVLVGLAISVSSSAGAQNPFLGKWNITTTGDTPGQVYWLEIKETNGQLTGMILERAGNPNPLGIIKIENGELVVQRGTPEKPAGTEYHGRIEGERLVGYHMVRSGGARRGADPTQPAPPVTERKVTWVGIRPPAWPNVNANGDHTYAKPVALFDGKTLDGWSAQGRGPLTGWSVTDGAMMNQDSGSSNLVSAQKFLNFKVEAEYRLDHESNSGIYLRGRYELQILDDAELTTGRPDFGHMAIYGRTAPLVKASKPAGEWQTMSAIVVANRVTVMLNGQRVHDNAVIEGVTGGALDNDETMPGPMLIQGDHRKITIRKLVVTPITSVGR